jgi:predicted nucleic acid-binding protein
VNVYVDTNLIVARAVIDHQHQADAIRLFREIRSHRWKPVISAHGLAEIYSILTRAPFLRPISPAEAGDIIRQNIVPHFQIEPLSRADYLSIIQNCALNHWPGGRIYDAVHIHAARKAKCARIFTMNIEEFRRIAPDLRDRITHP